MRTLLCTRRCYDQTSCDYRFKNAGYSMSSSTWKDYFSQGGIFETNPVKSPIAGVRRTFQQRVALERPDLPTQANKIFVTYCSSDAWVGDGEMYGYQFRGQRARAPVMHIASLPAHVDSRALSISLSQIVAAVLGALVQKQGMGNTTGTRLIFGGCSAGGRGALFNLDYVPDILAAAGATPGSIDVVGLIDAGLWVDIPPAVPGIISQQCQTAALAVMANATARMGAGCLAANPGPESWKCLYGVYRMPFIETPYIMQESQLDTFQVEININAAGDMLPPSTPSQFAFAARFQKAAKAAIATLPTSTQTKSALFSPACFHHCVTDAAGFWNLQIGTQSFRDVFNDWFINGAAPLHVADTCTGWKCGTCSVKRSTKGGKLKPGHGQDSPAVLLAKEIAEGNLTAFAPPAPGHPDPWGWSPATAAAADPLPAACVAAGLTPTAAPAAAPSAAPVKPPPAYTGGLALAAAEGFASVYGAPPPGAAVAVVGTRRSSAAKASSSATLMHVLFAVALLAAVPLGISFVWRRFVGGSRAYTGSDAERRTLL